MPQEPSANQIRYREQEEIQELISKPPGRMLRYGNGAMLAAVVLLLVLAAVIKYPDVLEAPVYLSSEQPVVVVTAPAAGILQRLLVRDGEKVERGSPLAVVGGQAEWASVRRLMAVLERLRTELPADSLRLPQIRKLGSLQGPYHQIQLRLEQLAFFRAQENARARIQRLEQQSAQIRQLNRSLKIQIDTLEKEVAIARNNYQQYETLFRRGSASELEVETAQTAYLRYQRQLQAQRDQLLDNRLAITRLESQALVLGQEEAMQEQNYLAALTETANRLQDALEAWKGRRLAVAPIDGVAVFTQALAEGQYLRAEQELAQLLPANDTPFLAIAQLAAPGIGKVRAGQEVGIRLEAYPFQEFGLLRGRVKQVAPVPASGTNSYLLKIELTDGLQTTFGQQIPFQQRLYGQARIITARRSFLGRLFNRLRSVFMQ